MNWTNRDTVIGSDTLNQARHGGEQVFFNNRRKKARETAVALENCFRAYFGISKHITTDGFFRPPHRFYFDEYILGFSITFINLTMNYLHRMDKDSADKKGEFILDVLSNMSMPVSECSELKQHVLQNLAELQGSFIYETGADHAVQYFGLTFGLIKPTNEHPLIQQSYDMAREILEMGIAHDHRSAQLVSLSELTLGRHIKARYLSSET